MRTKEYIRAELRNRLSTSESMPPFTAIETLICEAIDRLAGIPAKQEIMKPHEVSCFENNIKP